MSRCGANKAAMYPIDMAMQARKIVQTDLEQSSSACCGCEPPPPICAGGNTAFFGFFLLNRSDFWSLSVVRVLCKLCASSAEVR